MKKLEPEFIRNADFCGDHKFVQVKREGEFAAYIRYKKDNSVFGYEIFKVKVVKAGSKLPDGSLVQEDYEVYPGKNAFGATAMFISIKKEIPIDRMFEKFVSTFKTSGDLNNQSSSNEIILPNEPFSIKTIVALNPSKSYIDCYQYIKSQLGTAIELCDRVSSGRGKPTNMYRKIV
jgi:hypothetical protein